MHRHTKEVFFQNECFLDQLYIYMRFRYFQQQLLKPLCLASKGKLPRRMTWPAHFGSQSTQQSLRSHCVCILFTGVHGTEKNLFISENTGHPSQQRVSSLTAARPLYEDIKHIKPGSPQLLEKCVIKHFIQTTLLGKVKFILTLQMLTFDSSGILTLPTLRMHDT